MKKFLWCFMLFAFLAISNVWAQTHHISYSATGTTQTLAGTWWATGNYDSNGHAIYTTLGEVNKDLPPGVTVAEISCSVSFVDNIGPYSNFLYFDNISGQGVADLNFIMDYPSSTGSWSMVSFEWFVSYSNGDAEDLIDDYY